MSLFSCGSVSDLFYKKKSNYFKPPPAEYIKVETESVFDVIKEGVEIHTWKKKEEQQNYFSLLSYCSLEIFITPLSAFDVLLNVIKPTMNLPDTITQQSTKLDGVKYDNKQYFFEGEYRSYSGFISLTLIKKAKCAFGVVWVLDKKDDYEREKSTLQSFINNLDL